jgi:hypothetical protein
MGQPAKDFDSYARLLETAYAEHDDDDILREYILQRSMIAHAPALELLAHIFFDLPAERAAAIEAALPDAAATHKATAAAASTIPE